MTPPVDTPADTPLDLVDVREAARLVDRSPSTVRAWVRAGELDGYREDPRRRNSRLLVSRRELLVLAGLEKAPSPPRPLAQSFPLKSGAPVNPCVNSSGLKKWPMHVSL